MSNMHYGLAVDVERAWQYGLAWRIHSFYVGRVIWSITRLRHLGPHSLLLLVIPILEQPVISVAVGLLPTSRFSTSMYFLDATEQAL